MLREQTSDKNSQYGKDIIEIMKKGELVTDEIVINLIIDKILLLRDKSVIFDGFPRISNLDKIGYDTSELRNLFKKYNLYFFENTKSSYLDSQKAISSTMNLSLIDEKIKLDK